MSAVLPEILNKHWTPKGVFTIRWKYLGGSPMFPLFLDDREIGIGTFANLVAEDLAEGRFDDKLGFAAGPLNIPSDREKWNEGKLPISTD